MGTGFKNILTCWNLRNMTTKFKINLPLKQENITQIMPITDSSIVFSTENVLFALYNNILKNITLSIMSIIGKLFYFRKENLLYMIPCNYLFQTYVYCSFDYKNGKINDYNQIYPYTPGIYKQIQTENEDWIYMTYKLNKVTK